MPGQPRRVEFHISFNDPLMQMYAGNWARGMLRQMGQKEDEAMDGPMLSRSLKSARRKLKAHLSGDQDAENRRSG